MSSAKIRKMEDDVFRILADPTRRRILDLLAERAELTVSELAAEFPNLVTSGISKHLMSLRASGLVESRKEGRNQYYRISTKGFRQAIGPWIAKYESFWNGTLETLRDLAESNESTTDSETE